MVNRMRPENRQLMSKIFSDFNNALLKECPTHAFYRGEIFSDSEGNIRCELIATNINGSFRKVYISYDPQQEMLFHSRELEFDNLNKLKDIFFMLIYAITELPWEVNCLYFDVSEYFRDGSVEKIEGSRERNIYLLGTSNVMELLKSDNDDKKYLVGALCEPWMTRTWVQNKNGTPAE